MQSQAWKAPSKEKLMCCPQNNQAEHPVVILFLSELITQKFIIHPGNKGTYQALAGTLIWSLSGMAMCWSKWPSGAVPLAGRGWHRQLIPGYCCRPGASSAAHTDELQQDNPELQHTHSEFTAEIWQRSHSPKANSQQEIRGPQLEGISLTDTFRPWSLRIFSL